jgi:hypothetical protein
MTIKRLKLVFKSLNKVKESLNELYSTFIHDKIIENKVSTYISEANE